MLTRRDILKGMIAMATAPAIVQAGSIMRINPDIITPVYTWYGTINKIVIYNRTLTEKEILRMCAVPYEFLQTSNKIIIPQV